MADTTPQGFTYSVFNGSGACVIDGVPLAKAANYMTPERFERGWTLVGCVVVKTPDELSDLSGGAQ